MKIIKTFEEFTESLKYKESYNPATAMDSEEFSEDNNNEDSEPEIAESKKNDSEDQPIDNSSNKDNI
ncbi:hypothetical protein F0919_05100 [Taibaiella lutea]|uniref:Uncharacterized protein n=1 Tax=Taibaiella lutea TaxID=2608001 RepID=A0A5M6CQ18_9BACT|nr:hypothetical protein [Taibaiella lutea]KAA5537053.1 hypothetical protein F0919_05100 [Taibaiella lutea]